MSCYEHQKDLAFRYAKSEGTVVALYLIGEVWSFIEINSPEFHDITPIEFISPVQ